MIENHEMNHELSEIMRKNELINHHPSIYKHIDRLTDAKRVNKEILILFVFIPVFMPLHINRRISV